MIKNLTKMSLLFYIAACSSSVHLEMPPVPGPPAHWSKFNTSTLPGSSCPNIAGVFLAPPLIFQSAEKIEESAEGWTASLYGHIPFHLADRKELKAEETSLTGHEFLIRQTDGENFYLSFLTQKANIVEYHFQREEGDFACRNGYLEFPIISSYGMVEGMSANTQIRNVLLRDMAGSLVIQKTIGPDRGRPAAKSKDFEYEFLRYPLHERLPETSLESR
jgi:hypothetical protein